MHLFKNHEKDFSECLNLLKFNLDLHLHDSYICRFFKSLMPDTLEAIYLVFFINKLDDYVYVKTLYHSILFKFLLHGRVVDLA